MLKISIFKLRKRSKMCISSASHTYGLPPPSYSTILLLCFPTNDLIYSSKHAFPLPPVRRFFSQLGISGGGACCSLVLPPRSGTAPMITLFTIDCVFFRTVALLVFSTMARSSRAANKSARFTAGSGSMAIRRGRNSDVISSWWSRTRSDHYDGKRLEVSSRSG